MVSKRRGSSSAPSEEPDNASGQAVTPTPPTFLPAEEVQQSEQAEVVEQDVSSPDLDDEEAQIQAALNRKTDDGPGDEPAPPSNFESYATPGVEKSEGKSLQVIVQEVLAGKWGDHRVRRQRLTDAGHDASEIQKLVNMRVAGGAPRAYVDPQEEIQDQVKRLEWGASDHEVRKNLMRSGFSSADIEALLPHLKG